MSGTPYGSAVKWRGWLYVIPSLLLFVLFMAFPILRNVVDSLSRPGEAGITWFNYRTMWHDATFGIALKNSILWLVLTTLVQMALGFFIAVLLESRIRHGRAVFRTLLFLPMAITPTVIAIVFANIYAPDYGLLFGVFKMVGLAGRFPALLATAHTVTYAIILVNVWQWVGFYILMYSVGIASINREVLDAARVDGVSGWQRIRHIIFPMVRSTHMSLMILGAIQALQQFPLIYLMTEGGPANSSQVLGSYIFQTGFLESNMNYASAISVVLLLMALLVAGVQLILTRGNFAIGGGKQP